MAWRRSKTGQIIWYINRTYRVLPTHNLAAVDTVKRRVFYSFHYAPDNWSVAQVRNIGVIDGNRPATDNDWETVKRGGDAAIKRWIAEQMHGRSCTMVLIGTNTADRKWINHETVKSWNDGMGMVGIHIYRLKDRHEKLSRKGPNPYSFITHGTSGKKLSTIVKCYDPPGENSQAKYSWISKNLSGIVEQSIEIRSRN